MKGQAGWPYIVRWEEKGSSYNNSESILKDLNRLVLYELLSERVLVMNDIVASKVDYENV